MRPGRTRGAAAVATLCAVAVLLLGGCGTQVAGGTGEATPTGVIPWTTMQPSAVTAVQLADDQRTLTLTARVPDGKHPCVRALKAVLSASERNILWVQITYSSPSGDRSSGCTGERTASTRLPLPKPLGSQKLIVDNYTQFTTDGAELPALQPAGHRLHQRLLRSGTDRRRRPQAHLPQRGPLRRQVAGPRLLLAYGPGLRRHDRVPVRLRVPAGRPLVLPCEARRLGTDHGERGRRLQGRPARGARLPDGLVRHARPALLFTAPELPPAVGIGDRTSVISRAFSPAQWA
ncbi:hypothetical protein [Streptomyces xylophagus]|uniref:hypothetical protein n=1 Tax=Streptomyces xylophagus TaxID=285514 RepID=UPI002D219299|nr:hypothetical protein [Streptomyces xylophagus]